jgi:thiamine pyrophosphate-dependent acetolactate synthase large subunit-like protein
MPDRLVALVLERIERRTSSNWAPRSLPAPDNPPASDSEVLSVATMSRVVAEKLKAYKPSYIRLSLGWPGELCKFEHPLDYIGFDGGGGIGSGPGMAVGAALALRESGRFPVAILGDGDFLMGVTAIWTAVSYKIPLLIVVGNNQSFFNDELHQERVARARGRPIENRHIGLRMSDPPFDLAKLAEGQGAIGFGPISDEASLADAMMQAIDKVRAGAVCVIDARVAPEYSRGLSSTLLRHIPTTK